MAQAAPPNLDLSLSLEIDQLPVAGTLKHRASAAQRFDGWLELIAAIELVLEAARDNPPRPPGGSP
jgi:hypothetical protein